MAGEDRAVLIGFIAFFILVGCLLTQAILAVREGDRHNNHLQIERVEACSTIEDEATRALCLVNL